MDIPGASAHPGSTAVTTVGEANPLHKHHAALISIAVAGKPDPVTAAIARHLDESGSVYLELPDGRLALILDLSGATRLTRRDAQYLRD
jgi:DNA-binding GntR family transcriptional regulator